MVVWTDGQLGPFRNECRNIKCTNGPITYVLKWSVSHQLVLLSGNLLRIIPEKMKKEKESL